MRTAADLCTFFFPALLPRRDYRKHAMVSRKAAQENGRTAQKNPRAQSSFADSLHHPVLLAEGAAVVLLHPKGHAAVVEGVVALAPNNWKTEAEKRVRN